MRTDLKRGSGNGGDVTQSEERNIGVGCSPEDAGKSVVWGVEKERRCHRFVVRMRSRDCKLWTSRLQR